MLGSFQGCSLELLETMLVFVPVSIGQGWSLEEALRSLARGWSRESLCQLVRCEMKLVIFFFLMLIFKGEYLVKWIL